jgi:hypothetical protein
MDRLFSLYNVNFTWFLTGKSPSGLEAADMVDIELLDQEAVASHGREAEDYAARCGFQVPRSLIASCHADCLQTITAIMLSPARDDIFSGNIVSSIPTYRKAEACTFYR